jgi:hypothetical protein
LCEKKTQLPISYFIIVFRRFQILKHLYEQSRAINFGHFKILSDFHKLRKFPYLIMPTSTKCQKKLEKRTVNGMMIGYDIL